jgi:molybdopterin/thiamine biosynthesis adenylyltransferase
VALKTTRPVRIYDLAADRFAGLAHVIDLAGFSHEALSDIVALCPAAPCLDVLCAVRELTIDAEEIDEIFV